MNDKIDMKPIILPPFKRFCMTIGTLPTSYIESMSYYETLLWLCKYLSDTVIPAIDNNAEALKEVQSLFYELQEYVNTYFDNLDVQEEINNKLDTMVESGALEQIIGRYIESSIITNLNFELNNSLLLEQTSEYADRSFTQLQGFCYVNGNIIMGLRDDTNTSNYVRLVEYNPSLKQIIRSSYLTLYHCNSIAYNETDNVLYISATSTYDNQQNNDILVLDYDTFNTTKVMQISNLPLNHRIRSVSYDNETNTLYAGDVTTLFVIDEDDEEITETIELETTNLNLHATNQTLKKIDKWYVGIWVSFIAFWNLDKKLIKIINVDREYTGEKVGEVEDFAIFDNGDIVVGSVTQPQQFVKERKINFFKSNLYTNTYNVLGVGLGGVSETSVMYVDNTSIQSYENGTATYPFKNLQTAINVICNLNISCNLHVLGSSYGFTDIRNINDLAISFYNNVTIDGLYIRNSKVIFNSENYGLTINGLKLDRSDVNIIGKSDTYAVINPIGNTNITVSNGQGKCVFSKWSKLSLKYVSLIGTDSYDLIVATNSQLEIDHSRFDDYAGNYAINIDYNSTCQLDENVFVIGASDSQHLFRVVRGSVLFTQQTLTNYNQYVVSYSPKVIGAVINKSLSSPVYYGDVDTVNVDYSFMQLTLSVGGARTNKKTVILPTNTSSQVIIDTVWDNGTTNKLNLLVVKIESGVLKIKEHYLVLTETGTKTRETITSTPETVTDYTSIDSIQYFN